MNSALELPWMTSTIIATSFSDDRPESVSPLTKSRSRTAVERRNWLLAQVFESSKHQNHLVSGAFTQATGSGVHDYGSQSCGPPPWRYAFSNQTCVELGLPGVGIVATTHTADVICSIAEAT